MQPRARLRTTPSALSVPSTTTAGTGTRFADVVVRLTGCAPGAGSLASAIAPIELAAHRFGSLAKVPPGEFPHARQAVGARQ